MIDRRSLLTEIGPPAITIVALLTAWEVAAGAGGAGAAVPPPTAILGAIEREAGFFAHHAFVSALEAIAGLLVALAGAGLVASAFGMSRRARASLTPLVLASQTVPLVAIAPLVSNLIGDGFPATVIITAWLCWFPAAIAFTHGLLNVHPDRLDLFRVARATRWQTFTELRLPGAASSIIAGIRAAAGFALIGAIVTEYGGASEGLGAVVIQHVREIHPLAPDTLFGLIVVCSALGALITFVAHLSAKLALQRFAVDEV